MRFCTQNGVIRNVHQYGNRGREKLVLVRHARKNRDSFQNQRLAAGSGSPPGAEGLFASTAPGRLKIISACPDRNTGELEDIYLARHINVHLNLDCYNQNDSGTCSSFSLSFAVKGNEVGDIGSAEQRHTRGGVLCVYCSPRMRNRCRKQL